MFIMSCTQSLAISLCSVFNLNNKNVNALIAHELLLLIARDNALAECVNL